MRLAGRHDSTNTTGMSTTPPSFHIAISPSSASARHHRQDRAAEVSRLRPALVGPGCRAWSFQPPIAHHPPLPRLDSSNVKPDLDSSSPPSSQAEAALASQSLGSAQLSSSSSSIHRHRCSPPLTASARNATESSPDLVLLRHRRQQRGRLSLAKSRWFFVSKAMSGGESTHHFTSPPLFPRPLRRPLNALISPSLPVPMPFISQFLYSRLLPLSLSLPQLLAGPIPSVPAQ